jgi:hypothetical protein
MERLLSFTITQQMRRMAASPAAVSTAANHKRKAAAAAASKRSKKARTEDKASASEDDEDDNDECESVAAATPQQVLRAALSDESSPIPISAEPLSAGVIALQLNASSVTSRRAELVWAHSTPHFGIGFMERGMEPQAFISTTSSAGEAAMAAAVGDESMATSWPVAVSNPPTVLVEGRRFVFSTRPKPVVP